MKAQIAPTFGSLMLASRAASSRASALLVTSATDMVMQVVWIIALVVDLAAWLHKLS